jgi:MFS transporter, SP family, general alpha glucoside:H+ symporter
LLAAGSILGPSCGQWCCISRSLSAYGKVLITGFFVFPEFNRRFRQTSIPPTVPEEGQYEISPMWQMGLQNAAVSCEIIELLANGYVTDLLGYSTAMMLCLAWMLLATFSAVFATNIGLLSITSTFK